MSRRTYEVRRVADATAIYRDGQLIATAMYSNAGQCWNVTDERTATYVSRHKDRATAELHLGFVEWLS